MEKNELYQELQEEETLQKEMEKLADRLGRLLGLPHREYKDRVFRMLLKDPKIALEIYNAMNDTAYEDPTKLQITTLANAMYMGMKNDASFILDAQLVLYERQSTLNPNLPLRDLFYVACVLAALTEPDNLYGEKQTFIPEPEFVVFYNGTKEAADEFELRLSDAFERRTKDPRLELKVKVLNINYGHNMELAAKSPTLRQYMQFVDKIRKNQETMDFRSAVYKAVDDCIEQDILRDFLKKNKAEVTRMTIFEYDEKKHISQEKQESWEEGVLYGRSMAQEEIDQKDQQLSRQNEQLSRQTKQLSRQTEQLSRQTEQLSRQTRELNLKDKMIEELEERLRQLEPKKA